MTLKHFFIAFLVFVNVSIPKMLQSEETGVPIVIKGTVSDLFTGKFGAVTMLFEDSEGNKFKTMPDITNGNYQQVLTSGKTYKVTFMHYDVFRETFPLDIDFSDKYVEIIKDFKIRRLAPNLTLFDTNIFVANSAELSVEGNKLLTEIVRSTSYSRGAKLEFTVSGKSNLLSERIKTITNFAGFNRIESRITIITLPESGNKNDFTVIVTSIKDPLQ